MATDSDEILSWGIPHHIFTSVRTGKHFNGSQRCVEAAQNIGLTDNDWLINFQADEVCFPVEVFPEFFKTMNYKMLRPPTVCTFIAPIHFPSDLQNPNVVKVVCSFRGNGQEVIYFSRSPIPYFTKPYRYSERTKAFQHVGIYYTQLRTLRRFSADSEIENLEQLQPLLMGTKFYCHLLPDAPLQINTQENYDAYCRNYSGT